MKVRTVIISVVVSVALVLGVGYAAYYTMGGQATPVEVAPVTNVGYSPSSFIFEESMSGTVTSQVSQNVILDSEYPVEEIYVKEGDEVTEGEPLFSYDMTLPEIELEAGEIELMTLELQLTKYQKELQKYQGSSSTALLMPSSMTLTASAAELEEPEIAVDAVEEEPENGPAAEEQPNNDDFVQSAEQAEIMGEEGSVNSSVTAPETSAEGELSVESVESVSSGKSNEEEVYRSAVQKFEELMQMIEQFVDEKGELEWTDTVIEALQKAENFYQNQLTNRFEEQTVDAEGKTVIVVTYELKRNVTRVLSDAEIAELNAYIDEMETFAEEYSKIQGETETEPDITAEYLQTPETNMGTEDPTELTGSEEAEKEQNKVKTYGGNDLGTISGTVEWDDDENATGERPESVKIYLDDEGYEVTEEDNWNLNITDLLITDENGNKIIYTITAEEVEGYEVTVNGEEEYEAEIDEIDGTEIEVLYSCNPESENYGDLIAQFLLMAEQLDNSRYPSETSLWDAIDYYQSCLAQTDVVVQDLDGKETMIEKLLSFRLSDEVKDYLGSDTDADTLQQTYERLCFEYCILVLSSSDLDAEEQGNLDFYAEISELYQYYIKLDDSQRDKINKNLANILDEMAVEYGVAEPETNSTVQSEEEEGAEVPEESYTEEETDWDDYWGDDYWGDGDWGYDDDEYSSEEVSEIISELEENIKECELNIRESKLNVEQMQRIVDGKVVTSKVNGTVISIGDDDGNSDDEYFVKVTNTDGLYAKGVISELALDSVNVGDTVSGLTEEGTPFSAVIKEVSDYPDENGSNYVYGSGNSNAAYYTFFALIDDPDGVEEGYAELTLSDAFSEEDQGVVWLDVYFVRTDSAGNNYVYVQGDNGKLEKRYVTTGSVYSDWAVEITGGLNSSDLIAFPYGDDVYEGAPTKEVGSLESLYGD